jgi:uncharacterized protein
MMIRLPPRRCQPVPCRGMRTWPPRFVQLAFPLIAAAFVSCRTITTPSNASNAHAHVIAIDPDADPKSYIAANFTKRELQVPMRDGAKLFTIIYAPKDSAREYPIILFRTPYGIGPYGENKFRDSLGPGTHFLDQDYIFVYQDVRGKNMSEGQFVNMTPHVANKLSTSDIDESTDTYDTIEWLINNIHNDNGRIGQWGISYPGFYCAAGMIDAHPALKAVSPQAPIADWFFDDFFHHGAFFLPHNFNFMSSFGRARPQPADEKWERFKHGTPDGYQFFLDMGPLKNANEKYLHGDIAFWNDVIAHPNYDSFWQARNILPHLRQVAPAVLTVGGWFDAEDLYGALNIYQAIERQNPGINNMLVMGPWIHGGWGRTDGDRLGNARFGEKTSLFYRPNIELAFFNYYLHHRGEMKLPEASMFETGANRWRTFDHWPPHEIETTDLGLEVDGSLSFVPDQSPDRPIAKSPNRFLEFISDPAKPVPFTEAIEIGMTKEYMTDDQRFAASRPDVLVWQSDALEQDVTLAGPIVADLWVSTSAGDADWIVKVIDVFPNDAMTPDDLPPGRKMGGYQMMVRSEVIRGRFRNSYWHPQPFVPDQPARIVLPLQDVLHTFQKGHRLMVQVQSTWFPLVDRNPQKYVENIFEANEDDFIKATHRVYCSDEFPSKLRVGILPQAEESQ